MLLERASTRPPVFERPHELTEAAIRLKDGSTLSAAELASRFFDGEFGQAMLKQPLRYLARFEYDNDMMREDLGYDLCPIGHQMELPYHVGRIIDSETDEGTIYSMLSDEEIGILMLACMLHDIGESTHPIVSASGLNPVGDIPAGEKTDQNRADEVAVRQLFYDLLFEDVDEQVIERVEAIISHTDDTHLHELFDAGHVVQTIETSNFAYHALAREHWYRHGETIDINNPDGVRLSGLLGIARVPYHRSHGELAKYSHFAHVRELSSSAEHLRTPSHQLLS